MKRNSILILTLLFNVFLLNTLKAQENNVPETSTLPGGDPPVTLATIGMTVANTTVAHNSKVAFTFTGEAANNFVTIPPQYGEDLQNPFISTTFWSFSVFTASPRKSGVVEYTITNTSTQPITLTLKFNVGIRNATNNSTDYQYMEVELTVNPAPVIATRYYASGVQVTKAVYDQMLWDDTHGDDPMDGSYKTTYYTSMQAALAFGINDGGDAYNITLKNQGPPGM